MNLYVGNLYRATTEEALKNYFEAVGVVESVRIVKDRMTGQSRGFAFVTMASVQDGQAVIDQLNDKEFEGRPLRIAQAEERAPRSAGQRRPYNNDRRSFSGERHEYSGERRQQYATARHSYITEERSFGDNSYHNFNNDRNFGYEEERDFGSQRGGYNERRGYNNERRGYQSDERRGFGGGRSRRSY
jgi:RNA recognition motif-containing protein